MQISNNGSSWLTAPFAITYNNWDMTNRTCSGNSTNGTKTVYAKFSDSAGNLSNSVTATITYDTTPPNPPSVTGPATTNTTTPTWTWTSGGNGGNGTYRYSLDDITLSSATVTAAASFTPVSPLSAGSHALYVQERDLAGNWSVSGRLIYRHRHHISQSPRGNGSGR